MCALHNYDHILKVVFHKKKMKLDGSRCWKKRGKHWGVIRRMTCVLKRIKIIAIKVFFCAIARTSAHRLMGWEYF